MSFTPGESVGRYRIVREIGRGGEAVVFLAEDPKLGRQVALKVVPDAAPVAGGPAAERFRREVEALSRLDHRGICRLHDADAHEGIPFLVLAYVEGRTLEDPAALPPEARIPAIEEVARALQAAHDAGVVHGDLKPGNIVVTPAGRCVVLDFGAARLRDASGAGGADRPAGTLPYLAPEALAGVAGARTDVFGLGAVLFELVTGRPPIEAPTRAALLARIAQEPAPLARDVAPGIPRDLEAVLAKALDRDPDRRYATMTEFADDLARLGSGDPVRARRHGLASRAFRRARRRPAAAALAGFGAAFLAVAAFVGLAKNLELTGHLDRAAGAERRAAADATRAEEHFRRHARLADHRRLQELLERSRDLAPPAPERIPALEGWLADARALHARQGSHRETLDALRARGRVPAPDDLGPSVPPALRRRIEDLRAREERLAGLAESGPKRDREPGALSAREAAAAARRLRALFERIVESPPPGEVRIYDDEIDAWQDRTLAALVSSLERLGDPDPAAGMIAAVERRVGECRRLAAAEADAAHRDAWVRACGSIADRAESPRYDGLRIRPQSGLVPLRRDPASGLWEFLHLPSGEAPPEDAAGNLEMTAESGIVLVLVPKGRARVGARRPAEGETGDEPHVDRLAFADESPLDEVPLDPFFLSKFELTTGQWLRVRGMTPDLAPDRAEGDAAAPVTMLDWFEAEDVSRRLGLVLPTEVQWEYATRAGTATPWWTGSDPASLEGAEVFAAARPEPVGRRRPNPFGLHDVAGNACEWCRDVFARYDDPRMPGTGERAGLDDSGLRVRRGGSFQSRDVQDLRSARRRIDPPRERRLTTGLRPGRPLHR